MMQYNFLSLAFLCATAYGQGYTHTAWLDSDNRMLMNWRIDEKAQEIDFEVVGRTQGWMAIGFSANGAMTGADIILMWLDSQGTPQIYDAHAVSNSRPLLDAEQNVQLDRMNRNDTHLTTRFTRKMNTCDKADDWKITEDTVRVLWAFNDNLPTSFDSISKHETMNRGSRSLHLLFKQTPGSFADAMAKVPNVESADLMIDNGPVPSAHHTLYWCKLFSLPKQNLKHLVGYDVILNPPENKKFVHHFVLYKCGQEALQHAGTSAPCYANQKGAPPGVQVDASENPMEKCPTVLAAWAYGSDGFVFPDDTGLPMFAGDEASVYMLEMHYDNQDFVPNVVDNSGVRLYYTEQLRPVQSAHLILGQQGEPASLIIPPGEASFTAVGYCPMECTADLDPQGMQIYAGFLHTHLVGAKARIRHIRNGVELKPILADEHYDFNYQSMTEFKPVTVLPGDEILMECVYDSRSRDGVTLGGASTSDEMCYAFMYAKHLNTNNTGGAGCLSYPQLDDFTKSLGAQEVVHVHHYQTDVVVADPTTNTTRQIPLSEFLDSAVDWSKVEHNKRLDDKLEKLLKHADAIVYCQINADRGAHYFIASGPPDIIEPYVEEDMCTTDAPRSARDTPQNSALSLSVSPLLLLVAAMLLM